MRKHTPLMKTLRLWQPLTRELVDLAADGSLELMTLSATELASVRAQAFDLVHAIDAWRATHRPQAVPVRIVENDEHIGWLIDGAARYLRDPTDADALRQLAVTSASTTPQNLTGA